MSLLYFIISCEDLRPPLYGRFRHAVFSFAVVDIMYSSPFALFHTWEGSGLVLSQLEIGIISYRLVSFIIFTYLGCEPHE